MFNIHVKTISLITEGNGLCIVLGYDEKYKRFIIIYYFFKDKIR